MRSYVEDLREQLRGIHEQARHALDVSTRRQKRNYDRSKHGHVYRRGQFVWLYDNRRRPCLSKKLGLPWQGPYQVVGVLSDVVFRIQTSARGKTKVVHADRLKLYDGPALVPWVYRAPEVVEEKGPELHKVGEGDPSVAREGAEGTRAQTRRRW